MITRFHIFYTAFVYDTGLCADLLWNN